MNYLRLNKKLAVLISTIALAVASTSSAMCFVFLFDEPKMPKSLYKVD